jgi:glyoxylase-like metal-dependent hydrolase (beta-lactamase superfamily II)
MLSPGERLWHRQSAANYNGASRLRKPVAVAAGGANTSGMSSARVGITNSPPKMHLGDITLTFLDGGGLWLDGGCMFGIIPKPLWSRLVTADPDNRIPLATTCILAETHGRRVLVETGCGESLKYHEKERGFFSFGRHWIVPALEAIGVACDQVDMVILTHLHFDHAGGATASDGQGGWQVAFPRAKYVVQRGEWDDAVAGHAVMSGTYRKENLQPLERAGVLSFANGDAELASGISVRVLPGHTRHQQGVVFSSGGRRAILPADLMPTSAHVGLRHNMAYDLFPYENMRNKQRLLEESAPRDDAMLLGQDPAHVAWSIRRDAPDRFSLTPRTPLI